MASSRTGTAQWMKVRDERRRIDRDERGIYHCPLCRTGLDWYYSGRPNSAEVDHIMPHSKGGKDALENTRTICRACNQSLGGRQNKGRRRKPKPTFQPLKTSRKW